MRNQTSPWDKFSCGEGREVFLSSWNNPELLPLSVLFLWQTRIVDADAIASLLGHWINRYKDEMPFPEVVTSVIERLPNGLWCSSDKHFALLKTFCEILRTYNSDYIRERILLVMAQAEVWSKGSCTLEISTERITKDIERARQSSLSDVHQPIINLAVAYAEFLPTAKRYAEAERLLSSLNSFGEGQLSNELLFGIGNALLRCGKRNYAVHYFDKCVDRTTGDNLDIKPIWSRGLAKLLDRDYRLENLYDYCRIGSNRQDLSDISNGAHVNPTIPFWNGDKDCTVLAYYNQGLGEEVFFLRGLSLLQTLFPSVKLVAWVRPQLSDVAKRWLHNIDIYTDGDTVEGLHIDMRIPITSTIYYIAKQITNSHTVQGQGQGQATIVSSTELCRRYRKSVRKSCNSVIQNKSEGKKLVGVVWRSLGTHRGCQKSVGFDLVRRLSQVDGIQLIAMQHRMTKKEEEECLSLGVGVEKYFEKSANWIHGWDRIRQLDIFVSCSTAQAHLAASSEVDTRVLISSCFNVNFCWNHENGLAEWYDNCYIYEKRRDDDWDSCISKLCADIQG